MLTSLKDVSFIENDRSISFGHMLDSKYVFRDVIVDSSTDEVMIEFWAFVKDHYFL